MLSFSNPEIFNKNSKIPASIEMLAEFNYNSLIRKSKIGCYKANNITTYSSANTGSHYDDGAAFQFFDKGGVDTTMSASANSSTITVADKTGIVSGMRVSGFGIPADTYVTSTPTTTTVSISNNTGKAISSGTPVSFFEYNSANFEARNSYAPLSSIFEPNRPDPGIVNLVSYRKGSEVIDFEKLKMSNFGKANSDGREDRVYPMQKNSKAAYWSSVRKVSSNNVLSTVGVSDSDGDISYSAPFIVYEELFNANKIVVKTQKYAGYPLVFSVEYLDVDNNWIVARSFDGTESPDALSSGVLEIYYNGVDSWSTTENSATDISPSASDSVEMKGVRLNVTKMSAGQIPLEVIEISPRLQVDLSQYLVSFDKNSAIEGSVAELPSTGIISSTGNVSLFNDTRYFSIGTENSIISKYLYQGVEMRFSQAISGEKVKLGTFYSTSWNDSGSSQVSADLEDYFYFLKRQKAPNINIANLSGVETSVAVLILLDNAGITNYRFIKAKADSSDDYVMDFFYCSEDQTVADVLGDIASSAQYAIYIDVNNVIRVATKEYFAANRDVASTDFWLIGTEDWQKSDPEYSYLNNEYVANVQNMSEEKIAPITELTVSYQGNGITRQPKAILSAPELLNDTNNAFYNGSIVSRDLSFVNTELWSVDSDDSNDKVLLSMPYILDISKIFPTDLLSPNLNRSAQNINDLVRDIYADADSSQKKYFEIVLDQERGIEFLMSKKFSGYIMIDSELIRYRGMVIDVFDPILPEKSGRKIVFSSDEANFIKSSASSGVSILAYSLLVDLVYEPVSSTTIPSNDTVEYKFVSDGRGQENTEVQSHTGTANSEMLSNVFRTRLFATDVDTSLKPSATIKSESVNLSDPRNPESPKTYSYPGYLKLAGPKGVSSFNQKSGIDKALDGIKYLPIDNYGERFILGVYRDVEFVPNIISTRLRLLEKPPKKQSTKNKVQVSPNNRGIAGIGFKLKPEENGTTGYFLEVEDVGNITGAQLEKEVYTNMRLYKVVKIDDVYVPVVLKAAWVNVSATAQESMDLSRASQNEGRSYATTSDILISIDKEKDSFVYKVYWETNLVMTYKEKITSSINSASTLAGVMVRHDSEALFDNFLCVSVSNNEGFRVPRVFSDGSRYIKAVEAAERGVLPSVVPDASTSNSELKHFFEDFGKQLREARYYDVKFSNPSVSASIVSLDKVNPDYKITQFSRNSYGANFWVFNTSRGSIGLSSETSTPIIISGVALEQLNPGELTLSRYLEKKSKYAKDTLMFNKSKYGENEATLSAKFINTLEQAEGYMEWVWERRSYEKKKFNADIFPNPLIELGDKVRIFNSIIDHKVSKIGQDKCYYVTSINYSFSPSGPTMSISVEEI